MALIPLTAIDTAGRLRSADPAQVQALAESMGEIGLINPIAVWRTKIIVNHIATDGYGLISGLHRIEAARSLGWTEIEAHILDLPDLKRQLAECDENLRGPKLSPAERALFTRRRKEIYEALHPETRAHIAGAHAANATMGNASANFAPAFTTDTAARTGRSERAVELDAERGKKISEDVLLQVAHTDLDKGVVLDRLTKSASPVAELAAIKRERELAEAHKRNNESDRLIAKSEAEAFAEWLLDRMDTKDLPQVVAWIEGAKAKDITAALRRKAA